MGIEPKTLQIQTDADTRLAAAVGGAARFLADAAGIKDEGAIQLQSAVVAGCREAFDHLRTPQDRLIVTFKTFPDRIEVALSHQGEALPAVGLDSIAGFAAKVGGGAGRGGLAGVDRVQYETNSGQTVTRLTKYIGKVTPTT